MPTLDMYTINNYYLSGRVRKYGMNHALPKLVVFTKYPVIVTLSGMICEEMVKYYLYMLFL